MSLHRYMGILLHCIALHVSKEYLRIAETHHKEIIIKPTRPHVSLASRSVYPTC